MDIIYNKHYIRLGAEKYIVHGYSDAFEEPQEGDICIKEEGGRHFELNGIINPLSIDVYGRYNYRYVDGEVVEIAEADKPPMPLPIPSQEERIEALETALLEVVLGG